MRVPFASAALSLVACAGVAAGCRVAPEATAPVAPSRAPALSLVEARGSFLPTPLDGALLHAKNVDLQLPRGCEPLDSQSFVHVASMVEDEDADFLAACNLVEAGKARVTIVLMRHHLSLETGESAAAELRRTPGAVDVVTTTAGPIAGNAVGPEVVRATNLPGGIGARPSTSVYFGAQDGLYVLYAEVDGDLESLAAWGDALTWSLRPTTAAKPIRWRAPTKLAPGATAIGGHKMTLPEGIQVVPKKSKTLGSLVGDPEDPLDAHDAGALAAIRDEAGVAVGGNVYHAKLLPKVADSPGALARLAADVHHVHDLDTRAVTAKVGEVARVDGTRADGGHEVFAAFRTSETEVTVVRMLFTREKWPAYAPLIDASLASIEAGATSDGPY